MRKIQISQLTIAMMKNIPLAQLLALSLAIAAPIAAADQDLRSEEYILKADSYIKENRFVEAVDTLSEATKPGETPQPAILMRLATLYYDLGRIPDAISEGEKAVALEPTVKWHKYDLAKFYFVDKQYAKAENQLTNLLQFDPGFTQGYSLLAELYYRLNYNDMAWLSLQRAKLLGHQGKYLEERIAPHSSKPAEIFSKFPKNSKVFRFISYPSEEEAKRSLDEISRGKLFEHLELDQKTEKQSGVKFGLMTLSALPRAASKSLSTRPLFSPPVIVKDGPTYRIVQAIAPFDPRLWRTPIDPPQPTAQVIAKNTLVIGDQKKAADTVPSETILTTVSVPDKNDNAVPRGLPWEVGKDQLAIQLDAHHALESWKNAWQAADVKRYLAAYSSTFTPPDNMDLATWKKQRAASLTRPKFIHIDIRDANVELLKEDQLQITFSQKFESDNYQDAVVKTLILVKEKGGWKISEERSVPELSR